MADRKAARRQRSPHVFQRLYSAARHRLGATSRPHLPLVFADSGGGDRAWPREVLEWIEYQQEKAYRAVADVLKLAGPEEAFRRLSPPKREGLSPEAFRDLLGYSYTDEEWERQKQETAEFMARELAPSAPSFEDLVYRDRWLSIREKIIQATRASYGSPVDMLPYIATLPTWDFNALVDCFGEHHIIFFERGLSRYLSDYARMVSWMMPPFPKDCLWNEKALVRMVSTRTGYTMPPASSEYMLRTLGEYLGGGITISDELSISLPPYNRHLFIHLYMGMSTFVLLHEQAHLWLRHVADDRHGRDIEFEADRYAVELMMEMEGQQGLSRAFAFWTADTALRAFTFFEAALAALAFGPTPCRWISGTHPAPQTRQAALWEVARCRVSRKTRRAAESLRIMSDALITRTERSTLLTILASRGMGMTLSPLWCQHVAQTAEPKHGPPSGNHYECRT
jgi:hypothetical protein